MAAIPEPLRVDFESLDAAWSTIHAYIIEQGESYIVTYSNSKRYIIACRDSICKFRIRASTLKGPQYQITRYVPHSCSPVTHQNFRAAHSVAFLMDRNREPVADNREILP